ncbi:MAG: hypothetical protein N2319_06635 [Candidatus Kapabacteria bacterium]|nr:hypothetical protein [Candidatus Kapabacteria bacterium]
MSEELKNKIIELAKEFKVTKLILFGSSLDSFEKSEDVDLVCDGLYDVNFFKFGLMLERILNKPVDLLPFQPLNSLVEHIVKNGLVIYDAEVN